MNPSRIYSRRITLHNRRRSDHNCDHRDRPIDIVCDVCGVVLFYNLVDYFKTEEVQQSHISHEIFTNSPPNPKNILRPYTSASRITCVNQCHVMDYRWIVDEGSGMIDRRGFDFAIACGDGLAQFREAKHSLSYAAEDEGLYPNVHAKHGIQLAEPQICYL
eukprot:gb/GECH01000795.1/.p1 GENE.gb/GECH01000795.1/~~gb/GECH01000795.1/.p1  ORF type:complete len:161 (+),score=29.72 gb/GECH01000795.1/:1-483(+)